PRCGRALAAATAGRLVTFGVLPQTPETGYGYIKAAPGEGVRAVARFVEKPDAARAAAVPGRGRSLLEQRHVPVQCAALSG
ncbi:Nucleotidyl transferase domain protein, partial [mine drainage metagenome]